MAFSENYIPQEGILDRMPRLELAGIELMTKITSPEGNPFVFSRTAIYVEELLFRLNGRRRIKPFSSELPGVEFAVFPSGEEKYDDFGGFSFNIETKFGTVGVEHFFWFCNELCIRSGSTSADIKLFATVALVLNGVAAYPDFRDGATQMYSDAQSALASLKRDDEKTDFFFRGSVSHEFLVSDEAEVRKQVEAELERRDQ